MDGNASLEDCKEVHERCVCQSHHKYVPRSHVHSPFAVLTPADQLRARQPERQLRRRAVRVHRQVRHLSVLALRRAASTRRPSPDALQGVCKYLLERGRDVRPWPDSPRPLNPTYTLTEPLMNLKPVLRSASHACIPSFPAATFPPPFLRSGGCRLPSCSS